MKQINMSHFKIFRKKDAFTLIELLIVIAIIGVLAALLMANFIGVRQRSRDSQRKSDMRQIQSALELYRADESSYPAALPACGDPLTGATTSNVYIQKLPCDPVSGDTYSYTTTGTPPMSYVLIACLENVNDSQKDTSNDPSACTGGSTNWSMTLENP
ncbi:prepilin-type N-terminal cleavage/methylation domain-containing protein [Patescibacteria group bacterium]|nr:prepilin-type N-terminal cleavage/methylation domain-containing protein [Patescibacteria group bacterium]